MSGKETKEGENGIMFDAEKRKKNNNKEEMQTKEEYCTASCFEEKTKEVEVFQGKA